jgi:hypothetical protein
MLLLNQRPRPTDQGVLDLIIPLQREIYVERDELEEDEAAAHLGVMLLEKHFSLTFGSFVTNLSTPAQSRGVKTSHSMQSTRMPEFTQDPGLRERWTFGKA